eukprot:1887566-Karenia_brevis.AAC.1
MGQFFTNKVGQFTNNMGHISRTKKKTLHEQTRDTSGTKRGHFRNKNGTLCEKGYPGYFLSWRHRGYPGYFPERGGLDSNTAVIETLTEATRVVSREEELCQRLP